MYANVDGASSQVQPQITAYFSWQFSSW